VFEAYNGLGNLSDDITGKQPPAHPAHTPSSGPDAALAELADSWANRTDGQLAHIPNQDTRDPSVRQPGQRRRSQQRQEKLKTAKRLAMMGKSPLEIEQYLSSDPGEDERESAHDFAALREELGLLGVVYVDRGAFDSCQQMHDYLKRHANAAAEYMLAIPECRDCRLSIGGYCTKAGRKIVAEIDYSPGLLKQLSCSLAARGLIPPNSTLHSKGDLRAALLKKEATAPRAINLADLGYGLPK